MHAVIGLDTSCYTTSVALAGLNGKVIRSERKLLPVEIGKRGLRQNDAVFLHIQQVPELLSICLDGYSCADIVAVGMSDRPRDDDASYMPVFKVGSAHGRTLASALKIPLYSFSHQRGHVAAARHGSGLMQHSFLVLQLSGGTTELLRSDHQTLSLLGATKDINAGQLIDRVGVRLGYGFPCGMEMEKLAISGTSASLLPSAMDNGGLDCHFSGAETQAARWIEQGKPPKDIACEIFNFIARVSAKMITAAYQQTGVKDVLLTGGVSSSALIRYMLALRMRKVSPVRLYWGQPELSSDNAVGIALLAAESYILKE